MRTTTTTAKARTRRTGGKTVGTADGVRVVSVALDQRLGVFMLRLRQARTRATEPAVHDLRVSMRRLIAVLDLAREIAPDAGIASLRRKLRRSLKAFNAMRDIHISLLAMNALRRRVPAVRPYAAFLRTRERVLLRACGVSLKAIDVRDVERSVATVQGFLFAAAADPAIAAAMPVVLKGAMGRTYIRAVRALRTVHAADASTIHRLRIAFKKVRYTVEVLAPLTGGMSRATKKWMGEYQTLMGEVQDCEVMIAGARRFAAVPAAGRRIPMIAVQEELARRKSERLAAFLERAGELADRVPLV
jgi:CHAD domain-containing protein